MKIDPQQWPALAIAIEGGAVSIDERVELQAIYEKRYPVAGSFSEHVAAELEVFVAEQRAEALEKVAPGMEKRRNEKGINGWQWSADYCRVTAREIRAGNL